MLLKYKPQDTVQQNEDRLTSQRNANHINFSKEQWKVEINNDCGHSRQGTTWKREVHKREGITVDSGK
jgi:hypothetical protein